MTPGPRAAGAAGASMLAVDLGGTRMRVAVFDADCSIIHRATTPTPPDDPAALPRAMRAALNAAGGRAAGAVVGVPGVVNYATDAPPRFPNLPAWRNAVTARRLAEAVGIPVLLANDADLAALGEHRFGAGDGVSDMVYMTTSTGVGAGVIIGGQLLHGRRSLAEAGHTIIDYEAGMTVEQLGSGTALRRISGTDGAELVRRIRAGDEQARAAFDRVADAFGIAVANMIHCFMPQRVVIGGGVSQAGDLLLSRVRRQVARSRAAQHLPPSEIVIARGGDDVGLRGAFALWQACAAPEAPDLRPSPAVPENLA